MEHQLINLILFPFLWGIVISQRKADPWLWAVVGAGLCFAVSLHLLLQNAVISMTLPLFTHCITLQTTPFSLFYGCLSCGLWLVAIVISSEYFQNQEIKLPRYYGSLFFTLTGCLGIFFAGDFLTLFIFFEIMSISSVLWVLQKETKEAVNAAELYLSFGIIGGLMILFGLFLLTNYSITLPLDSLTAIFADSQRESQVLWGCIFMFMGFGAKAGVFFLHDWLPHSYKAAPAPATGLLSGILSKCGIYGILLVMLRIIPDLVGFSSLVLFLSLLNMLIGAFSALLSGNLKQTLAFSSVSQIGFILWGIALCNLLGEHNAVAAYGTFYHMINHSLIKVLLFSLVALVISSAKTLELEELRGFGRGKTWFQGLFTVGFLALTGVPLFSGYVSKTLLHEAIVEYMHYHETSSFFFLNEWIFLLSGGFTVAYMLKLYHCLFLETGEWAEGTCGKKSSLLTLSVLAVFLLILGFTPNLSFMFLGDFSAEFFGVHHLGEISYFSWTNLKGALISWVIGFGLFCLQKKDCQNKNTSLYQGNIDLKNNFVDWVYRPVISFFSLFFGVIMRVFDVALETVALRGTQRYFKSLIIPETFYYGEENQIKRKKVKIHITHSLAYSLLMFGFGFIFTIVYLLVVGGTIG